MTDEPTTVPLPENEGPAPDGSEAALAEAQRPRRPFILHFPRAPIPGTVLTIRSASVGQDQETMKDVVDPEIDDREFTVKLVQRQLDQEQPLDEVRAWPDEQLLAAGEAFLSLDTTVDKDDEVAKEGESEDASDSRGDEGAADTEEVEPLTFAALREEIKAIGARRAQRMRELIGGIVGLTQSNTRQLAELIRANPAFDLKLGSGITDSLKRISDLYSSQAFKGIDASRVGLGGLGTALSGIDFSKLGGLSDTSRIGAGLGKMLADRGAVEKLTRPAIEIPRAPDYRSELMSVGPIVRPEVRLLEAVGETLEKMHDDQMRTADGQVEVMVEQTKLLKAQGEALTVLVNDAKGQKWPRRVSLAIAIIAAVAAVAAALYAGGILRPFGAPTAGPTVAPVISPSVPAPSPTSPLTQSPSPQPTPSLAPTSAPVGSAKP